MTKTKIKHIDYVNNVLYMEGMSNYTKFIFVKGEPVIFGYPLKYFENKFGGIFIRISRKYSINNSFNWRLVDNKLSFKSHSVVFSRRKKKRYLEYLNTENLKITR